MRYMKEGLIPAEGERHKVQRKVVQKLFSGSSLRVYAGLIQEKADQVSTTPSQKAIHEPDDRWRVRSLTSAAQRYRL